MELLVDMPSMLLRTKGKGKGLVTTVHQKRRAAKLAREAMQSELEIVDTMQEMEMNDLIWQNEGRRWNRLMNPNAGKMDNGDRIKNQAEYVKQMMKTHYAIMASNEKEMIRETI